MPIGSAPPEPLLLDTHYWIWTQAGLAAQLSLPLRTAIQESASAGTLLLSVISVWELGLLVTKGRVQLEMDCGEWVRQALATPGLVLVPLTPEIAIDSSRLPEPFHGDPADRIIIATACRMGARLATRDRKMLEYARRRRMAVLE